MSTEGLNHLFVMWIKRQLMDWHTFQFSNHFYKKALHIVMWGCRNIIFCFWGDFDVQGSVLCWNKIDAIQFLTQEHNRRSFLIRNVLIINFGCQIKQWNSTDFIRRFEKSLFFVLLLMVGPVLLPMGIPAMWVPCVIAFMLLLGWKASSLIISCKECFFALCQTSFLLAWGVPITARQIGASMIITHLDITC